MVIMHRAQQRRKHVNSSFLSSDLCKSFYIIAGEKIEMTTISRIFKPCILYMEISIFLKRSENRMKEEDSLQRTLFVVA